MSRFLPAFAVWVVAAIPPPAKTALDRIAGYYGDGSAHAASFTQTYTPAGFASARRESGIVRIQAPQRLRFDYTTPEKKTFTYDGVEGRLLSPADGQLTIRRLSAEDRARLPVIFLSDPAELDRQYAISVEPADSGGARLLLTPRTARPDLAWLRVSAAADGSINSLAYEDSSGSRSEFRFESWRKEEARPASDYRITGPPGTRILEN